MRGKPAAICSVKKRKNEGDPILGRLFTFGKRLRGSLLLFLRWCLQVKLSKIFPWSYIVRTMKTAIEKTLGGALAAVIIATANVHADDPIRLARYTLQSATAEASQLDLLAALIETEFPPQIETAGDAIDYVLLRSGYRRIETPDAQRTIDLPLPRAHRKIGPLDLRSAIKTLAGQPWHLHEDPIQRVIWLTLKDDADLDSDPPEIVATTVQETPTPPPASSAPLPQVSAEWTLDPSLTLRGNFDIWTRIADWSLEWNSRHDYAVDQVAAYNGTLKDAVTAVLEHYRTAPIPLTATFYAGNAVLVVEPLDSSGR